MPLTNTEIVNAKPREKPYRLFDGRGLHLEVATSGGRWWRFKYRFNGKEKRLSLGVFPDVSLKAARDRLDEVRRKLASGIDPAEERKGNGPTPDGAPGDNFESIAREWFAKHSPAWAPGHGEKIIRRLELNIFPWVGQKPIRDIKPMELLGVVQRIEQRGANETAHRALQNCGLVFRYAVATGRAERDITRDLLGALAPVIERHHASIVEPKAVGALLRAIDGYAGSFVTRSALQLAPLVFVRPGELRMAEWTEFNLEEAEWRIPTTRMPSWSRGATGAGNPATLRSAHRVGVPSTTRGDPAFGMARLKADKVLATPAYPLIEAAHYLNLPLSTLRAWCLGQPLRADAKTRRFEPLIRLDGDQRRALSFLNLVEAHVLAAIRRKHHIPLPVVRRALDYVAKQLRSTRPLAEMQFQTDGVDLIVDRLGTLINVTREGQTEMADVLRQHLKRIERNAAGVPVRLFPFTRTDERSGQPAAVVIDPHVAFGRPVLAGRAVPTAVLADRFKAGDSFEQLAGDYGTSAQAIEEALRCELDRQAA